MHFFFLENPDKKLTFFGISMDYKVSFHSKKKSEYSTMSLASKILGTSYRWIFSPAMTLYSFS